MDSKCLHDSIIQGIRQNALRRPRRIVITDGEDERAIEAVVRLCQASHDNYNQDNTNSSESQSPNLPNFPNLQFILLGSEQKISRNPLFTKKLPQQVLVKNPIDDSLHKGFAKLYFELRDEKGKPVSLSHAEEQLKENAYFGAMLVRLGYADGMIGGSSIPTAKLLKAGIDVIGMNAHSKVVSGSFLMFLPRPLPGGQQMLVLADCAVVPNPDAEQLADIALNTVQTASNVIAMEPVVAFVSFSTKGSANYAGLEKLKQALSILRERAPNLRADGELQIDAALVPEIGERKDPNGFVRGRANVLIFPDLNSGNIAYKLVERVGGAKALGVVLSGFAKPVNDLSRGCSTEDIMDMICVTALQSEGDASTVASASNEGGAPNASNDLRGRMEA